MKIGNMFIYVHVQINFDAICNKLFPGGETLQFLSLKYIFQIWPQKKKVMTLWENYTLMPPMRINCYAGLWHHVLKKGRKFRCQKKPFLEKRINFILLPYVLGSREIKWRNNDRNNYLRLLRLLIWWNPERFL